MKELQPGKDKVNVHNSTSSPDFSKAFLETVEMDLAESTRYNYQFAVDRFQQFCEQNNCYQLPVPPAVVANYLQAMESEYKVSVIKYHFYVIRKLHEYYNIAAEDDPTNQPVFKRYFKGLARKKGTIKNQATPFKKQDLFNALDWMGTNTNTELRNRALLAVGWYGAFRSDELVNLNCEDLILEHGQGYTILVRGSKTDIKGEGMYKALPIKNTYCPVSILEEYLEVHPFGSGPLFLSMRKGDRFTDRRITRQGVHGVLKKVIGPGFSPHSLRAGFVTSCEEQGFTYAEIMNQTGHKDLRSVRDYDRKGSVWISNAAVKL